MFRLLAGAGLAVITATLVGCGDKPKLVPATGKVTHKNGPVTAATLTFHPDSTNSYQKDNPSSLLQVDGSFTMKTFPFGEGVPPGRYKVTLSPDRAAHLGKPELGDPTKTPWSVEVPESGLSGHEFRVP